jgi:L-lactate dehydrogenase complex protein LldE
MITHHYDELFAGNEAMTAKLHELQPRVFEFSRFLLDVAGVDDVGAKFNGRVTYHDSCHALRELGLKEGPRRLLRKVEGLELVEMDAAEECCGFGGTFSVKFHEISGRMAATKVESILRTGATHVVSLDSSCLMQLQGTLSRLNHPVKTIHLAEVLASR